MLLWIGFSLSVVLLLFVSRRNLALGMAVAAAVLAGFTLTPASFGAALWQTISDPSVLLLALVVGLIPLIGGAMETSGEMGRLVSNLRIGIRPFLAFAPALLGMLPMPGGALLSAPMIERGAGHTAPDVKAAARLRQWGANANTAPPKLSSYRCCSTTRAPSMTSSSRSPRTTSTRGSWRVFMRP